MSFEFGSFRIGFCSHIFLKRKAHVGYCIEKRFCFLFIEILTRTPVGIRGAVK